MIIVYIVGIIGCVLELLVIFIGFKDKLLDKIFDIISELIGIDYRFVSIAILVISYLLLELFVVGCR